MFIFHRILFISWLSLMYPAGNVLVWDIDRTINTQLMLNALQEAI